MSSLQPFKSGLTTTVSRSRDSYCRKHEEMSVQMFDTIIEDKQLFERGDLTKAEAERVRAMILAGAPGMTLC